MERSETPYLLTRKEAAERYSISERQLDRLIRRDRSFPAMWIGRAVKIHRERADQHFTEALRTTIYTEG